MKAANENKNGFFPTRKSIVDLFNNKSNLDKHKEIIELIYSSIKKASLLSLDFADIKRVISKNSQFTLIKSFESELYEHQKIIDSSSGAIIVFNIRKQDSLRDIKGIVNRHFSKVGNRVEIAIPCDDYASALKIDFVLAKN